MYLTERPSRRHAGKPTTRVKVSGTVVLMGLVSMFTDISSESVSAVLALYLTSVIGLTPLAYGFIDGLYQGVSALVRIFGGWAADRGDHPKWVALCGYGLSAIARIALIPAQGLAAVTSVITIDRLGKGIRTAPRDSVIAAASAPGALGRSFGVHRALDTLGAVIGPLLAFTILAVLPGDYRAIFVVSFAAAVIGLAMLLLLVPDIRPRRMAAANVDTRESSDTAGAQGVDKVTPSRPSLSLVASPEFGRVLSATALLGVLTIGDGFLYLALQHRDDLAVKYFPLLYVGTNFAYMAQAMPLGRLADRIGRARVFLYGHLALIAAYVCAAGPVSGAALTVGCLLFMGTYYASTDGQLAALTSQLFDERSRGSAIATAQTVQAVARFVSSLAFGAIWQFWGQRPAILIVTATLLLALPIAFKLIGRHDRIEEESSAP